MQLYAANFCAGVLRGNPPDVFAYGGCYYGGGLLCRCSFRSVELPASICIVRNGWWFAVASRPDKKPGKWSHRQSEGWQQPTNWTNAPLWLSWPVEVGGSGSWWVGWSVGFPTECELPGSAAALQKGLELWPNLQMPGEKYLTRFLGPGPAKRGSKNHLEVSAYFEN